MSIPRAGQVFGLKDGKSMCLMICDILLTWAKQKRLGKGARTERGFMGKGRVSWAGQGFCGLGKSVMGKAKVLWAKQRGRVQGKGVTTEQGFHRQSKAVMGRARMAWAKRRCSGQSKEVVGWARVQEQSKGSQ
eukprot:CAMPEP_0202386656 /NCGR_PEP_ID=MMETSP1127-20130417/67751_1 /ASSEMBLY_ACC=CAM_ASM_000462 /TAXON_ID=3047 /ORGANISM="Dunaliella tertiolecta, Strain CCMP1320" /LENGTH=132 /DNA_ID=CAMNT_0048987325 /DNA_START=158 /DNA_END=557 /DNA_ORIENTATION=+